jgi:WD40 repeat protein
MTLPALDERLPTPKLDDRRFQDLVDEAKRRVQQRCPEWTDHNVSDPGVTLIETFAWMTDQLLYRLNRVPDLNYVKFLELIGVRLFPPTAARVEVTFRLSKPLAPNEAELPIPSETQVSTPRSASGEQITFATKRALVIPPCTWQSVASADQYGVVRGHDDADRVVCFSDRPQPGDALLVGLNRPVPSCTVLLEKLHCEKGGGITPGNAPLVWDARVGEDVGTVSLWDTHGREEIGRFTAYDGQAVRCVAFSLDTHKLASAGDGPVWLRDVHELDRSAKRLDGHEGAVRALAFSTDGRRLASAGDDGTVRIWDVHAPDQPALRLDGHAGRPVFAVAFDQRGTTLASAGADGTVRLWTVEDGKERRRWDVHEHVDKSDPSAPGHLRCVLGVSFLEDEQRLAAAADDGTLWLLDLEEREQHAADEAPPERRLEHPRPVFGVAFSPDGKTLATAGADGTVRLWAIDAEAKAGADGVNGVERVDALEGSLKGHQGPVYDVAFSRDGKTIATVGSDWTARLWRATGGQIRRPLSDRCPVHAVAFHPTRDLVATAGLDGAWAPCEVEADKTGGLIERGDVILKVRRATTSRRSSWAESSPRRSEARSKR